jgi:glycosyltransferase involved in cell wall biosynthesis
VTLALGWVDLDDPTDRAVALGLGARLRAAGEAVVLVGPRRGVQPARETVEGLPVERVGLPGLEALSPLLNDALSALQLLELQSRLRVELWHAHLFARRHRALSWAASLGRLPLVATLHLILPDYLDAAGGRGALGSLLARAARVTAVSAAGLEQARALFPELGERGRVVPNGLPPAAAPEGEVPAGAYALCASRLAPYKGLDLLVMALARPEFPKGLRLVLCGRDQMNGGLQEFARKLGVQDSVVFMGEQRPERLRALLEGCSVFALPSRRENLPLALLEAMAAGKPVVASRVGGVPEIVTHGDDGLLVEPGDVAGLAGALASLVSDSGLRERLGRRARERSRAFGWDQAARAYRGLYRELA